MDPLPIVSVAVATYQRRDRVRRLIDALEKQTLDADSFEVIVADDASMDDTYQLLEELSRTSGIHLRFLRNETNLGPAASRNRAWRSARAPIIAFTDDDCVPVPRWLELGVKQVTDGTDVLVGKTSPNPEQIRSLRPFSRTMDTTDERYYATCNIFYRRDDLEAVGGFDDGFKNPGGEDIDLAYRVRRLGRRTGFAPEVLVLHDVRPPSFRATVRETMRWEGIVRCTARNPREARREHLWRRYFWKPSHPRVILAMLGLVMAPLIPIALGLTVPYLSMRLGGRGWRARARRLILLPPTFVIDVLEVYVMSRASLKYRTLVL